jgi:hypothetical protein
MVVRDALWIMGIMYFHNCLLKVIAFQHKTYEEYDSFMETQSKVLLKEFKKIDNILFLNDIL